MPKQRAFTHWTADTCTAFFMALRFHGTATRAAAEIGRSVASAYKRRERDAPFALRWDEMIQAWRAANVIGEARELAAIDEERAMPNRERFDGFTPLRQRAFLRALTETGTYADACRRVNLSTTAARNMRERYPEFAAACDRALAMSVATLEQAAVERAVQGVEEPVWHAGKVVGTRVRRSDTLLKLMLVRGDRRDGRDRTKEELVEAARDAARLAGGRFSADMDRTASSDAAFADLAHKLDRIANHARRQEVAKADRLRLEGKAP